MVLTMLLIEDDDDLRIGLDESFRHRGFEVVATPSVARGKQMLLERRIDLALLDMRLPDGSGLDVLEAVRALDDEIPVIMMTAYPETKTAVRAMQRGALDYIVKPFELTELHLIVDRAVESRNLRRTLRRLEREQDGERSLIDILGSSRAIERLRQQIQKVAPANAPVLIMGETGTGKELVMDALHRLSPRRHGPLVKVNCSVFSESLLESEILGHEKGAFTDAKEARPGLFELADGGTLFLDEITEMKPGLQANLLRVVEGQPFRRIGGRREIRTDVRVVAATNRSLKARIESGEFREDLYYRLNVFQIDVPPLRDREQDVVLLAKSFLDQFAAVMGKGRLHLSAEANEVLSAYQWPGNARELRNVMERAAILCEQDEVGAQHLPAEIQASAFVRRHHHSHLHLPGDMPPLAEIERQYIGHVVKAANGNLTEASRILGIARNTLKAKIRQ